MLNAPMEAKEITEEEIQAIIPPPDIFVAWHRGEDRDWPPDEDEDMVAQDQAAAFGLPIMPSVRFQVGTGVECRVGPTEWAAGTVTQLWYREQTWPEGSWAPYRVELEDGREIFAPGDIDLIIRLRR